MARPRILDLFSGAGGAARGYQQAGFHVTGVDIAAQPRYAGDEFVQADAMAFPLDGFNAIHASPPCQAYSTISGRALKGARRSYPDLIAATRDRLLASRLPFVLENVEGAPVHQPVRLCGSSFGLDLRRHRLFDCHGFEVGLVPPCAHHWQKPRFRSLDSRQSKAATVVGVHGHTNYRGEQAVRERAMGIDWMDPYELTQAIPPAYTHWLGERLLDHLMFAEAVV